MDHDINFRSEYEGDSDKKRCSAKWSLGFESLNFDFCRTGVQELIWITTTPQLIFTTYVRECCVRRCDVVSV